MMKITTLVVLALLLISNSIQAKSLKDNAPEPKTKLEAFSARTGTVIIRGFENIGSIHGLYGTKITIDSKEFIHVSSGTKEYGITIEVTRGEREDTSYIDYDEINSLIKGITYISKVNKSATKFSDFQADYKTKGDFEISIFNSSGDEIMVAVSSGYIGKVTAYYELPALSEITALIAKAKNKIDSVK